MRMVPSLLLGSDPTVVSPEAISTSGGRKGLLRNTSRKRRFSRQIFATRKTAGSCRTGVTPRTVRRTPNGPQRAECWDGANKIEYEDLPRIVLKIEGTARNLISTL